jgi:hypothetical protein
MAQAALVEITEVRIQSLVIEGDVFLRIPCGQPGRLYRDVCVARVSRQLAFFGLSTQS